MSKMNWIKKKYRRTKRSCQRTYISLKRDSLREWYQTKVCWLILGKWWHGRKLEKTEIALLETEGLDIVKIVFIAALSILPMSNFMVIVLIKLGNRVNINILPSAFKQI